MSKNSHSQDIEIDRDEVRHLYDRLVRVADASKLNHPDVATEYAEESKQIVSGWL